VPISDRGCSLATAGRGNIGTFGYIGVRPSFAVDCERAKHCHRSRRRCRHAPPERSRCDCRESSWRGYDYFMVGDQIVIVDPRSMEIVAIIDA
jgi:hypothetical protein